MEGDAGSGQLTPAEAAEADTSPADETEETSTPVTDEDPDLEVPGAEDPEITPSTGGPDRLGRGWLLGIAAALVVSAVCVSAGGYVAYRAHRASDTATRADAAAVANAKDCLLAIHAPDPAMMNANQRKILECATGAFTAQAPLWISVLAEAYATGDVHVEMLDMQAAVERHHDNGSIDVLAAFRVFVSTTNQEVGYRLRVNMAPDNGQYKVADIAQVSQ